MPSPRKNEDQSDFIQRCMSSEESKRSFPDHILNRAEQSHADEKTGSPPNCNEGYYEKNEKCVPMDYTEGPTEAGSKYKCPYDDLDTVWTGRTKTILSRPFYVMRCPHGHETLSKSPN